MSMSMSRPKAEAVLEALVEEYVGRLRRGELRGKKLVNQKTEKYKRHHINKNKKQPKISGFFGFVFKRLFKIVFFRHFFLRRIPAGDGNRTHV